MVLQVRIPWFKQVGYLFIIDSSVLGIILFHFIPMISKYFETTTKIIVGCVNSKRLFFCCLLQEANIVYISPIQDLVKANSVGVNFAELITYAKCQGLALSDLVPVFSMWRYSSDIMSSGMLKKWMDSAVFSFSPI